MTITEDELGCVIMIRRWIRAAEARRDAALARLTALQQEIARGMGGRSGPGS
jgi:hypothetical protein